MVVNQEQDYLGKTQRKFRILAPLYDLGFQLLFSVITLGRGSRKVREEVVKKIETRKGRILDICTGTGAVALMMAKRLPKAEVTGFDSSGEMLKVAQRKAKKLKLKNIQFETGDARKLPFEDGSFAVVTCSLALHEIPEASRKKVIREMVRVLKEKGEIVILEWRRPKNRALRFIFDAFMKISEPEFVLKFLDEPLEKPFQDKGIGEVQKEKRYNFLQVFWGKKTDVVKLN